MVGVANTILSDDEITIENLKSKLCKISNEIKSSNRLNLSDINIICEEIFGKILNDLYGYNLVAMTFNSIPNFVSVDLVDKENGIAYQVTSRCDMAKIIDTVNKFKEKKLGDEIDSLYILTLSNKTPNHRNADEKININAKNPFTIKDNVIDFNSLIKIIEEKSQNDKELISKIYQDINMVFDCGRLNYSSIVDISKEMSEQDIIETPLLTKWEKGYRDIHLLAHIPMIYNEKLACHLEFVRNDISGITIALEQDEIESDYFVSLKEFESKHIIRDGNDDECWINIGNIRMQINANTAFHIYLLFDELRQACNKCNNEILECLGANDLKRKEDMFLLTTISRQQLVDVIEFARKHDCWDKSECDEWNIFNNDDSNSSITLSKNGETILAIIIFENSDDNNVNVYWKPGYELGYDWKKLFENNEKWKADYTKDWFINCLLPKIEQDKEINDNESEFSAFKLLKMKINKWISGIK